MYRIFGSEMSPYSVKVRAWFRYKGVDHAWTPRNQSNMEEYQRRAKLPLIPLVVTPDDKGIQDSTPIIDALEKQHPEPGIHPDDAVCRFVSILLEEFGDEWGNKWMFHLRWAREADQLSAASRIAGDPNNETRINAIRERMVDRVWFVGSNERTTPIIETSFREAIRDLDGHLANRPYLMGHRPSYADFALWGQIYNAWTDPTGASLINGSVLNLLAWIHRMLWPTALGEFESWDSLEGTLMPFLRSQVGELFTPWTLANERALAQGEDEFTVELDRGTWTQTPQKYHAKSLSILREKYSALGGRPLVDRVLADSNCASLIHR